MHRYRTTESSDVLQVIFRESLRRGAPKVHYTSLILEDKAYPSASSFKPYFLADTKSSCSICSAGELYSEEPPRNSSQKGV